MAPRKAPATLVLLVRHGRTPTTGRVLPGRAPGLHLADEGRAEAEAVAERLAGLSIDALYASPLERARETAAPTERLTGLTAITDEGLAEADVGDWTGVELTQVARDKRWRTVQQAPSTFRFPGGESFAELQARAIASLERLRTGHAGGVVVCFSHADPIKVLLTHALGTHLDHLQRVDVTTGSVSAIEFPAAGAPVVKTINSTSGPLAPLRA